MSSELVRDVTLLGRGWGDLHSFYAPIRSAGAVPGSYCKWSDVHFRITIKYTLRQQQQTLFCAMSNKPSSSSSFEWSHAPDKILQQTKDNHIIHRLENDVQNVITKVVGANAYENWAPEFQAISQLLYFVVTRVGGQQTLGEEYTDLQLVVSNHHGVAAASELALLSAVHLPSLKRLSIFAALSIGVPYVYARLQRGAAAHNSARRRRPRAVPDTMLGRFHFTLASKSIAMQSKFWSVVTQCVEPTSRIAVVAALVYQLHRMFFFFRSDYQSLSMRFTGLRQIVNRQFREGRASYSILGMLLLLRMMIGAGKSTYGAALALLPAPSKETHGTTELDIRRLNSLVPTISSRIESKFSKGISRGGRPLRCLLCTDVLDCPTLTPCGHLFCWDCVVPWCSKRFTCPLCRQPSPPQQLWTVNFDAVEEEEKTQ